MEFREPNVALDMSLPRFGPQAAQARDKDAAGLIHDLNNALTVVMTSSVLLASQVPPQSPLFPDVSDIFKQARVAADLVQKLSQELRRAGRQASL